MLTVKNLKKYYPIRRGVFRQHAGDIKAVDGVSFTIRRGETLGLVGESGCGKSTTGRSILQLERPTAGEVIFEGRELTKLRGEELRRMRRHMQIIFQDPYASLNPRITVGEILDEPLQAHGAAAGGARRERVRELQWLI